MTAGVLVAALATQPVGCSSPAPNNEARTQASAPPRSEQPQRSADAQFAAQLAEHYRHGVLMLERAEARSIDPAVREIVTRVRREEARELAKLHHWLAQAGERWDAPQDPHTVLDDLDAAQGRAFDRALLDAMVKHHQHAIELTKEALPGLRAPELRSKAEELIGHHEREMAEISRLAVR